MMRPPRQMTSPEPQSEQAEQQDTEQDSPAAKKRRTGKPSRQSARLAAQRAQQRKAPPKAKPKPKPKPKRRQRGDSEEWVVRARAFKLIQTGIEQQCWDACTRNVSPAGTGHPLHVPP